MCYSAQHSLAKWLVEVLKPVLESYSGCCVKDSFTFSSIISRLPVCMESQFLVSFDVVSLFTNIPLDKTKSICAEFFYHCPSTIALPFPEEVFIELMGIATKSVSFSFNEIMYRQIDSVSMGFPLCPILANISVGFQERNLFDRCGLKEFYTNSLNSTDCQILWQTIVRIFINCVLMSKLIIAISVF